MILHTFAISFRAGFISDNLRRVSNWQKLRLRYSEKLPKIRQNFKKFERILSTHKSQKIAKNFTKTMINSKKIKYFIHEISIFKSTYILDVS